MISAGILFFTNSTQDKNIPAKIEPPAETVDAPEKVTVQKNYVKVKYRMDGQRSAAWTDKFERDITNAVHSFDIGESSWRTWQSAGGGAIL